MPAVTASIERIGSDCPVLKHIRNVKDFEGQQREETGRRGDEDVRAEAGRRVVLCARSRLPRRGWRRRSSRISRMCWGVVVSTKPMRGQVHDAGVLPLTLPRDTREACPPARVRVARGGTAGCRGLPAKELEPGPFLS